MPAHRAAEPRTVNVSFRLTEKEAKRLDRDRGKKPKSEYIISKLFQPRPR